MKKQINLCVMSAAVLILFLAGSLSAQGGSPGGSGWTWSPIATSKGICGDGIVQIPNSLGNYESCDPPYTSCYDPSSSQFSTCDSNCHCIPHYCMDCTDSESWKTCPARCCNPNNPDDNSDCEKCVLRPTPANADHSELITDPEGHKQDLAIPGRECWNGCDSNGKPRTQEVGVQPYANDPSLVCNPPEEIVKEIAAILNDYPVFKPLLKMMEDHCATIKYLDSGETIDICGIA